MAKVASGGRPKATRAGASVGDVITLARRVGEPVVLRVAGVEVARGELVEVEGEVGVRITQKTGGS
mgnify:CR=1 FL=1